MKISLRLSSYVQAKALHKHRVQFWQDMHKLLLENGVDVNLWCDCGEVPLQYATKEGHIEINFDKTQLYGRAR
ncbi:hypothetical protein BC938DRAFT_477387 [Jimgerdemannia flammicorona]|uniref:Uncharacterized protein n=1 Tax=Jimgerdemannia flammicorona TaxID=994334 RepID=A0A433QPC8_9FUNG|nr:hypothetical protein BC938DRAFT_477387 [Jimgerdemannia flammicorona]